MISVEGWGVMLELHSNRRGEGGRSGEKLLTGCYEIEIMSFSEAFRQTVGK